MTIRPQLSYRATLHAHEHSHPFNPAYPDTEREVRKISVANNDRRRPVDNRLDFVVEGDIRDHELEILDSEPTAGAITSSANHGSLLLCANHYIEFTRRWGDRHLPRMCSVTPRQELIRDIRRLELCFAPLIDLREAKRVIRIRLLVEFFTHMDGLDWHTNPRASIDMRTIWQVDAICGYDFSQKATSLDGAATKAFSDCAVHQYQFLESRRISQVFCGLEYVGSFGA